MIQNDEISFAVRVQFIYAIISFPEEIVTVLKLLTSDGNMSSSDLTSACSKTENECSAHIVVTGEEFQDCHDLFGKRNNCVDELDPNCELITIPVILYLIVSS
jgi:hypothetical protein